MNLCLVCTKFCKECNPGINKACLYTNSAYSCNNLKKTVNPILFRDFSTYVRLFWVFSKTCVYACISMCAHAHTYAGRYPGNEGNRKLNPFHTVHYNSNIQCNYSWFSVTDLISYNTLLPLNKTIIPYQNMFTCNAAYLFSQLYLNLNWNFSPGNLKAHTLPVYYKIFRH